MTLQEYLAAEGLTAEEIAAIVGNEKQAKAMTKALGLAEEGRTLKAQADKDKQETAQFWEQKTSELQKGVERLTAAEKRAAQAEAAAAQRTAYLKSLADQGYDVPKEYYEGTPAADPAAHRNDNNGQFITREEWDKRAKSLAPDLVRLNALSNEYQFLTGQPYLTGEADLAEAVAANKPMVEYVKSKYSFATKKAEKDQAAAEEAYQKRHKAELEKERAEWAAKNGNNPDTRTPVPSRFDKLTKSEGFNKDSWKSEEGRKASREARLKKFENAVLQ